MCKIIFKAVLRIRIRDPVPFWPLDPGWVKNQDPGYIWVKILKVFDADAGRKKIRIRDGKNSDPRETSRIRNTASKIFILMDS